VADESIERTVTAAALGAFLAPDAFRDKAEIALGATNGLDVGVVPDASIARSARDRGSAMAASLIGSDHVGPSRGIVFGNPIIEVG
jgi:hypothetical protein